MAPVFFFQVIPMKEADGHPPNTDLFGRWNPPKAHGGNVCQNPSPIFYCNGTSITTADLSSDAVPYKTFSIYYYQGNFYIINFDASTYGVGDGVDRTMGAAQSSAPSSGTPPHDGNWQLLHFEHNDTNYGSIARYAEQHPQLRTQRSDEVWTSKLLPLAYHAAPASRTENTRYGGLSGELPLILGLVAMTISPEYVQWVFQNCFRDGGFVQELHDQPSGWVNGRGVVVKVWFWPPYSTREYLEAYEGGEWGYLFS